MKGRALAVRSTDSMIASGDKSGEIRLWDGKTGQFLRTLAHQVGYVSSLSFSSDGARLLSTCGYGGGCNHTQRVWEVVTGKELTAYTGHDNTVYTAVIGPDSHSVATGGFNGDVQIWDLQTGQTKRVLRGIGSAIWAAGFSADERRIGWGTVDSCPGDVTCPNALGPLQFQLTLPSEMQRLGQPEAIKTKTAEGFARVRATYGPYVLSHRKGGNGYDAILEVMSDGKALASIDRESDGGTAHRSYSFTPDGQTIISGGNNGFLAAYNLVGKRLANFVGHDGEVWDLAPSPTGRFLVSGSSDQTVRLWNFNTRELIVTLFYGNDGEWVMWTPQGYYTGSPGADKIVGWQINKGPDQAADYIGAEQLRQHLNRPDIVERAIILASAEQAVREAPGTTFQVGRPALPPHAPVQDRRTAPRRYRARWTHHRQDRH